MGLTLVPNCPERAIAIMREVAAWGRERGLRVWLEQWLTPEELLTDEAGPSNFYVGAVDGEEACAFILQWSDREWWPEAEPFEAGYLHKLCVRRKFAHRGMTAQVVEAVKAECARRGVRRLRLDTGAEETAVGRIYLAAGFEVVRAIERDGGPSMLLYELTL
ncbi:MAG: GNAT family N-acetyltransferase [Oscillospiraceae bacterium]|nr:GNAT family N-acetyltransferase [Oscillospiraceae bacterium]